MSWHFEYTAKNKKDATAWLYQQGEKQLPNAIFEAIDALIEALPVDDSPVYVKTVGHIDSGIVVANNSYAPGGNAFLEVKQIQVVVPKEILS